MNRFNLNSIFLKYYDFVDFRELVSRLLSHFFIFFILNRNLSLLDAFYRG